MANTTTIKKFEVEAVCFTILGAIVGIFLIGQTKLKQQDFHDMTNIPAMASNPTATPTPFVIPTVTTSSQISPDGTKKVTVKVSENKDGTKTYDVTTSDGSNNDVHSIISKTLTLQEGITIPFNTWSPDNKYFFIQEHTQSGQVILVFKATGEPFADGENSLDATAAFTERATGNDFGEATGWASETLIVINTTLKDGTKGPSYWFEVPSKAVIQLSTQF